MNKVQENMQEAAAVTKQRAQKELSYFARSFDQHKPASSLVPTAIQKAQRKK